MPRRRRRGCSRACRSRSPPPRPALPLVPPGGWRSRFSSTWTGPESPSACPTTAAACDNRRTESEDRVDLFDLTGKVAVVTGGTRGIGLMMARGLLQAGASVYVSSRKPEAGEAAVAELSGYGRVVSLPADLASEQECVRLAQEVGRTEERVHILVNNAGTTWVAALEDFPSHAWDKVVDLNLKTPFYLTRAFLPLLEAA